MCASVELQVDSSPDRDAPLLGPGHRFSDAADECDRTGGGAGPHALPPGEAEAAPPPGAPSLARPREACELAAAGPPPSRSPSPTRLALEARLLQQGAAAQARLRALLAAGGLPRPRSAGGARVAILGTVLDDGSVSLEPVSGCPETPAPAAPHAEAAQGQAHFGYAPLIDEHRGGSPPPTSAADAVSEPTAGTAAALEPAAGGSVESELARVRGALDAALLRLKAGRDDYELLKRELEAQEAQVGVSARGTDGNGVACLDRGS